MADVNGRLVRALDGPAPQHKIPGQDKFQPTEGSDGQLHTRDQDVSERLTAIENKLDSVIENGSVNTQVIGSKVEDGIVTKPRIVEVFSEENIKVNAGSFVQYDSFSNDLKYGTVQDMRDYSHAYFGGQSFSGAHNYYLLMRQKPFGTSGSMIIDDKTETTHSTKYIKKTPITFHNLSLRVYNESEEEQTYTLGAGFWPV